MALGFTRTRAGVIAIGSAVINVGIELGVIPPSVVTMLVIMAIVSTTVTTPSLRA